MLTAVKRTLEDFKGDILEEISICKYLNVPKEKDGCSLNYSQKLRQHVREPEQGEYSTQTHSGAGEVDQCGTLEDESRI